MAHDYSSIYPGQMIVDAAYPQGKPKNETSEANNDGTPYEQQILSDIIGPLQCLLKACSIAVSGSSESADVSQYVQSIVEIAAGRAVLAEEDAGSAADAYIVVAATNQQAPQSLYDNLTVVFETSNTGTGGATTLQAYGLANKPVKRPDGNDPNAGELDGRVRVYFDATADNWVLDNTVSAPAEVANFTAWTEQYFKETSTTALELRANLTASTWTTVGPTGSGATVIYSELDSLPLDAEFATVTIQSLLTSTPASTQCNTVVTTRRNGGANQNLIHSAKGTDSAGATTLAAVPLDSNNIFELRFTEAAVAGSSTINFYVTGFRR